MTPKNDLISRAAAIEDLEALMWRYREIGAFCARDGVLFAREHIKKLLAVDAIPVAWIAERALDSSRAPMYRRYARLLIDEWQREQGIR